MSTTSSGVDLPTKYQKLAAEYAKLRAQIPVLKKAVVDEQARNQSYEDDLRAKDQQIRTLITESESLTFRNQQLTKRVEFLQERLDETGSTATNNLSPIRFFRRPSLKHNRHGLSQSISHDHLISASGGDLTKHALEEELARKLEENELLNKKIYEIENGHEKEVSLLKERIHTLETEATSLRSELANIKDRQDAILSELKLEKQMVQSDLEKAHMESLRYKKDCETSIAVQAELKDKLMDAQRVISNQVLFDDTRVIEWNRLNVPSIDEDLEKDVMNLFTTLQPFVTQTFIHLGLFHSYCKQRAQLYPCDTNLGESLSDVNAKYCTLLRDNANICRSIESAFQTLVDKCRNGTCFAEQAVEYLPSLFDACENYAHFLLETHPLVQKSLSDECATGWCTTRLAEENGHYARAYERFAVTTGEFLVPLKYVLTSSSGHFLVDENILDQLFSCLERFNEAVKGMCDQFSLKIINEHQLPVATRQLRTTNECIAAALNSASKYVSELCRNVYDSKSIIVRGCNNMMQWRNEWAIWRRRSMDYYRSFAELPEERSNEPIIPTSASWHNVKYNGYSIDNGPDEGNLKLRLQEKEKAIMALEKEKEKWILETQLLKMKLEQHQNQVMGSRKSTNSDLDSALTYNESSSVVPFEDSAYIEEYYGNRVAELSSRLQDTSSRVVFFQTECQNLLKTVQIYQKQKEKLHVDLRESSQQIAHLKDELETTRKGYETQLSTLSEHLAQMNLQLTKQTDEIDMLKQAMKEKLQKKNRFK